MKKIIVLGGAGFIGSHLCAALLARGHHVTSLDNYFSGHKKNIAALSSSPHFKAVIHDVNIPFHFDADEIYNLACPASPIYYQRNPVATVITNVMGSINALNLAVKTGAKILQASTSEVYGDPLIHPQTELYNGNVNPIGPRACYDEGKRCAETLFFDYHREKNAAIKVVRIFNTYGPNMSRGDGRVVSNFIVQALEDKPITVYGDGGQTRSFCFIDDMVEGLIRMMDTPAAVTGPVNLGNPEQYVTMLELAELIRDMVGSRSDIIFKPLPFDDPCQRRPDIARAKAFFDWQPTTSLRDGLQKTIEYFR